jgi:hypothetical protein
MELNLAQVNVAKMLGPIDGPVMAGFVANLDPVNALAESSEGFLWRLKTDDNNATSIKMYDDDFLIVNMSVWKDIDALFKFVYNSNHVEVFKRKKEWFERMPQMHMACWYVPAGYNPTVVDAAKRLEHLRTKGETPHAFSFKKRFTAEDAAAFNNIPL